LDRVALLEYAGMQEFVDESDNDYTMARHNDMIANKYLTELAEEPSGGASFILSNKRRTLAQWSDFARCGGDAATETTAPPHALLQYPARAENDVHTAKSTAANMASQAANLAVQDEGACEVVEIEQKPWNIVIDDTRTDSSTSASASSASASGARPRTSPDVSQHVHFRGVPKVVQSNHPITTPMPQEEIDGVSDYYYRLHSAEISAENAFESLRQARRSRHFIKRPCEDQVMMYSRQVTEEVNDTFSAINNYMDEMFDEFEERPMGNHSIKRFQRKWFNLVVPLIAQEQEDIQNRIPARDRHIYGSYFNVLPPEILGAIVVQEVLTALLTTKMNRIRFTFICQALGKAIQKHVQMGRTRTTRPHRDKWANISSGTTPEQLDVMRDHDKLLLLHDRQLHAKRNMNDPKVAASRKTPSMGSRWNNLITRRKQENEKVKGIINRFTPWDNKIHIKVGAALLSKLIEAAKVENPNAPGQWEPAFNHERVHEITNSCRSVTPGYIILHDWVIANVLQVPTSAPISHASLNPMCVPPVDWTTPWNGGYLMMPTALIRERGRLQSKLLNEGNREDQTKVYDGVNAIQKVAWKLNRRIYDIQTEAHERGLNVGDLPPCNKIPLAPPSLAFIPSRRHKDKHYPNPLVTDMLTDDRHKNLLAFTKARLQAKHGDPQGDVWKDARNAHQEYASNMATWKSEMQSNLTIHQSKLSTGRKLYDDEGFYFPYSLDFRGRAYPTVPTFNHLGRDDMRSLIEFAEKKPLGKHGFRWLKIHLANLMGYDKVSFDDREKFTEEHMDQLHDSVLNPLEGNMWWLDADSPWQALAVMMEIRDVMSWCKNQGLPHNEFLSGMPVHQDGSCNGLQHYAALGRDLNGAAAVNLIATEDGVPADVYSRILGVVVDQIATDSELHTIPGGMYGCALPGPDHPKGPYGVDKAECEGQTENGRGYASMLKEAQESFENDVSARQMRNKLARVLNGHVDRKMVKQTVMTSVYGVTRRGARDQVQRRIVDKIDAGLMTEIVEPVGDKHNPSENLQFKAADYVAALTLDSIGTVFNEAQSIMDWLAAMAAEIGNQGEAVQWMTPIGFPVIQPYRKYTSKQMQTCMQHVVLAHDSASFPVDKKRQKTAFPPNFVHSLDATHMLMTAKTCDEQQVDFAAVHDSYWTQAGTVDQMNEILRNEFVNLYTQSNVLEDFAESAALLYPGVDMPPLPARGKLDLNVVKTSPFFFS
jgi:DNA-directed RNA polymerase